MKGYIFSLSKSNPQDVMKRGVHGTWQPRPKGNRGQSIFFATLGDYLTVKPQDKVFFFADRLIYGIGRVIDPFGSTNGVFLNYPNSSYPHAKNAESTRAVIGPQDDKKWRQIRVVIPFVPDPFFFEMGIDMDEVLASPGADVAWGLRFWEGFSFRQLGEAETQLLTDVFMRRFAHNGANRLSAPAASQVTQRFKRASNPPLLLSQIVRQAEKKYVKPDGSLRNEKLLHCLIAESLTANSSINVDLIAPPPGFKSLDIYHEFPASPPKPPIWSDKIDFIATNSVSRYPRALHYKIVEIKKDRLTFSFTKRKPKAKRGRKSRKEARRKAEPLSQLMKYVDFIANTHVGRNYAAISAIYIAAGFGKELLAKTKDLCARQYVLNPREDEPSKPWGDVTLMSYFWNLKKHRLELREVFTPGTKK